MTFLRRRKGDGEPSSDRRLHESGGPAGGTTGGYIDSFENMPGAQNQPFGAPRDRGFVPESGMTIRITSGPDGGWLAPDEIVDGHVVSVVPGLVERAAIVVELRVEVTGQARTDRTVTGRFVVLEPSGVPSRWARTGTADAEVWAELPPDEPWLDRQGGVTVDRAARYDFA